MKGSTMFEIEKTVKNLFKYKDLLKQLVTRDIKLKYRRSFLGYLWSVLNPLMIMMVMVAVFSTVFRSSVENFPVYLLSGNVIFSFMVSSTQAAIFSITDNGTLIKKTYIPKSIFTLSKVCSCFVDFIFSLSALFIVMVLTRAPFHWINLMSLVVVVQLYIFCLGLGLILATANVYFRDIQYIYNALTTAWMYFTPIFYPIEILPEQVMWLEKHLNPMYFYVYQFRSCIYDNCLPESSQIMFGTVAAILSLLVGIFVFRKNQDKFILFI